MPETWTFWKESLVGVGITPSTITNSHALITDVITIRKWTISNLQAPSVARSSGPANIICDKAHQQLMEFSLASSEWTFREQIQKSERKSKTEIRRYNFFTIKRRHQDYRTLTLQSKANLLASIMAALRSLSDSNAKTKESPLFACQKSA